LQDKEPKIEREKQKQKRLVKNSFKIATRTGFATELVKHCEKVFKLKQA
jgi:hypothetical protein